jgi:DNA modification methylase
VIQTSAPTTHGADWTLVNGDSIEELAKLAEDAVDLSVYSPPFIALYTYTASERDMGNCATTQEFFQHFGFLQRELLRVTKPGRLTCVHVAQVPAMLSRDGYIGMKDFRGMAIQSYIDNGWIYHGEVCIDKDPQAQAIRTKSKSLLFVQLRKDSSWMRMALADYILLFRKPGENPAPIQPDITNEEWIEWARPIWYGIRESDTLQVADARDDDDERHVCPLQLGTIERCVRLWSNPGELVLSPFAGIGSEGYKSVGLGRRFLGIELKPSYYALAVRNLQQADAMKTQGSLFAVPAGRSQWEESDGAA